MATQSIPLPFQTVDQAALLCRVLEELDHGARAQYDSLTPHEQEFVRDSLVEMMRGDSRKFQRLWEIDYTRKPVSVQQFIEDKDYFGGVCEGLYPCWRHELDVLFNTDNAINEIVITGAIGTGKTTLAIVALAYKLYSLTCLRNPFQYYGLMEGTSSFVFGLFNATLSLSANVHVSKVLGALNSSPYFRWVTQGSTEALEKESGVLKFPNNIKFAFGSRAMHALGQDIIGGMLDEMNFTILAEQQQAIDLYRNTKRRILSRFPPRQGRKSPGLLFMVSSRKGEEDFLDVHIRNQVQSDPTVRVVSYSLWDAKGHLPGMYSGQKFRVMVGDDRIRSRILDDGEDPEGYQIVDIPIEHYKDFKIDPDGSLMDLAGVPIKGGGRPLLNREKLHEAVALDTQYKPRKHPFKSMEVMLGMNIPDFIQDSFLFEEIVDLVDPYRKTYRPKVNPLANRVIHLDPATTGDCSFGLAMGHIAGRIRVKRRDPFTMTETEGTAPVIYVDLMLGIKHPPGDEIDFAKVRAFILFLRKLGFPIYKVTADQYQSTDTLQVFTKLGYKAKKISLDSKPEPYSIFRQSIHEGRLLMYDYPPFVEEAIWLQVETAHNDPKMKPKIGRVYCLPDRHKDISDSVAGVVTSLMEDDTAEDSAIAPVEANPEKEYRPRGAMDDTGDWLLDGLPDMDIITGVGR